MKVVHIQEAIPQPVTAGLNLSAIGTAFAAFLGYLPSIAAGLSVAWLVFQFWVAWKTKPWKKGNK